MELDEVSPDNPVFLEHISGHVAVVNTQALKHAEITAETPNPAGGEIERYADGEATGMLKEDAAMEMVTQRLPAPTDEESGEAIELVFAELARNGVTSVQDNSDWDDFEVYKDLKQEGSRRCGSQSGCTLWTVLVIWRITGRRAESTDLWLKTGAVKMVTDGALGSRTAAMTGAVFG